jgi:hypothetical protein
MVANLILKDTLQAKKLTDDLNQLVSNIVHDNIIREDYHHQSPAWQRISALNEQVAALRVYMGDITESLERQEFFCSQLRFAGTMFLGAAIGLGVSCIYFLGHG